mmetsp:Transcript_17456/g.42829  ORF Transcript_17456/g.42829 Transcript_17456/m.42829 type:complete len:211 (-) Transcript_17456:1990-2622(-)
MEYLATGAIWYLKRLMIWWAFLNRVSRCHQYGRCVHVRFFIARERDTFNEAIGRIDPVEVSIKAQQRTDQRCRYWCFKVGNFPDGRFHFNGECSLIWIVTFIVPKSCLYNLKAKEGLNPHSSRLVGCVRQVNAEGKTYARVVATRSSAGACTAIPTIIIELWCIEICIANPVSQRSFTAKLSTRSMFAFAFTSSVTANSFVKAWVCLGVA